MTVDELVQQLRALGHGARFTIEVDESIAAVQMRASIVDGVTGEKSETLRVFPTEQLRAFIPIASEWAGYLLEGLRRSRDGSG